MHPDDSDDAMMHRDDAVGPGFGIDGHLDESAAHAFVDGALDDGEAARVVLHLGACAQCAAVVAEARGFAAAAAGIVRRLDDGPGALAVFATPTRGRAVSATRPEGIVPPRRASRAGLRAAAAALVAVAVGGSAYVVARRSPVVPPRLAHAPLGQLPAPQAPVAEGTAAGGTTENRAFVAPSAAPAPARAAATAKPAAKTRGDASHEAGAGTVAALGPLAPPPAVAELDRAVPAFAPAPRVTTRGVGAGGAMPDGVVVGQVRDAAGRPVPGTTILVAGTTLSTTSDDAGRFTVRGVPPGTVTLRAQRIGYGAGRATVAVGPTDTARALFQLGVQALSLEAITATGVAGSGSDSARVDASATTGATSIGDTPRSDVRRRRTGSAAATPSGCYAVARIPDISQPTRSARGLVDVSPLELDADADVRARGVTRGTWALDAGPTLRVTWNDRAMPPLVLHREGAGWAGAGVRLTRIGPGACSPR